MNEDSMRFQKNLDEYIDYFESLTLRSVGLISKLADSHVRFSDPFNDVHGVENMQAILEKMFHEVEVPKFQVIDYAWGRNENTAYLKWNFSYLRKEKKYFCTGMTELIFNDDGAVTAHIDHWDAASQFYEKIPVLGSVLRFIKNKIGLPV